MTTPDFASPFDSTVFSRIISNDFPILRSNPTLHYLDSAATTHQPDSVMQTQTQFIEESYGPVQRSVYDLGVAATAAYENARSKVATFINAQPTEIIFTRNATEAFNLAAWIEAGNLHEGDEILISAAEHHSNLLPWQRLACRRQAKLTWIELDQTGHIDLLDFQQKLTSKTKLVAITHLSNVLGSITPLAEIITAAHRVGAKVAVDAAQSISRLQLDVALLGADYVAFSGHKMYGPTGIGVLYAPEKILQQAEPLHVGGGMVQRVTRASALWSEGPARFEAGTPPVVAAVGLAAAINYLEALGLDKIWQHEQALTQYALTTLAEVPGFHLVGPSSVSDRAGILSFQIEVAGQTLHSHDVATIANAQHVCVRAGHHCAQPLLTTLGLTDVVRASFAAYTTREDIDALAATLMTVHDVFTPQAQKKPQVAVKAGTGATF